MNFFRLFALGGVLAVALAGMTAVVFSSDPAPTPPPSIPEQAKAQVNPFAGNAESIEFGKTMFEAQCAMCHGKAGDGSGDLAAALKLTMPRFNDPQGKPRRTDGEYFWIVSEGCGTHMRGEKARMPEETRWHLVSYVRTLAGKKS